MRDQLVYIAFFERLIGSYLNFLMFSCSSLMEALEVTRYYNGILLNLGMKKPWQDQKVAKAG